MRDGTTVGATCGTPFATDRAVVAMLEDLTKTERLAALHRKVATMSTEELSALVTVLKARSDDVGEELHVLQQLLVQRQIAVAKQRHPD